MTTATAPSPTTPSPTAPSPTATTPARWRTWAAGAGGGLTLLAAGGLWVLALLVLTWDALLGWTGRTVPGLSTALCALAAVATLLGAGLLLRARWLASRR